MDALAALADPTRRELVELLAAGELAAGIAGQVVAMRRRHPYDTPVMSGRPENVGRDSFLSGTALSAPVVMLAGQAWAIRRLRAGPADGARRALGGLGVVMVAGYLMERLGRARLTPGGFDPVETPVVVVGLLGAAAMGVLGHRDEAGR